MKLGKVSHLSAQDSSVSYAELKVKENKPYGIGLMDNKIICNALDGDRREELILDYPEKCSGE